MADLLALDPVYMMLPLDENPFAINANTRAIVAPKIVTLQNDQIAEMITFTIDRYYDYMDLDNATIYVQWTLPSGKEGATKVEFKDLDSEPGKIRFGWPLDADVTSEVGKVKYSVRFWQKGIVENTEGELEEKVVYSFNTLTSEFTVSPSLQINVNDVANTPKASNFFIRSIKNSILTGEGVELPQPPFFGEPGLDLPVQTSLKNNTLTLKAQAVVGDTGAISYRWFYKPAEDIALKDEDSGEVIATFKAGAEYSHETTTQLNDNGETDTIYGFGLLGGVAKTVFEEVDYSEGLKPNEQYYEADTIGADGESVETYKPYVDNKAPEDGRKLYEKFAIYTVPTGDVPVTGEYRVEAVNTVGGGEVIKNGETVKLKQISSNPQSSAVCHLISPNMPEFTSQLPSTAFMVENGETVSTTLEVKTKEPAKGAVVTYEWYKNITNSDTDNEVVGTNAKTLEINEPGWYMVKVSEGLNRETKSIESNMCKIMFAPEAPQMEYNYDTSRFKYGEVVEGEETLTYDIPTYEGEVTSIQFGVKFNLLDETNRETYKDHAVSLFSDKVKCEWTLREKDSDKEKVIKAEEFTFDTINETKVTSITANATGSKADVYTCHISNTLNGKTTSASLSYLIK